MTTTSLKHLMPENFDDIANAADVLEYCKKIIANYTLGLSDEDIKNAASAIVWIFASEHFDKITQEYPIVSQIESLAENLEWANTGDLYGDWKQLIRFVNRLDQQINNKKLD